MAGSNVPAHAGDFVGCFAERHIAGQNDHGHALLFDRRVHRGGQNAWKLRRVRHEFDVVTALLEELLRMRLLKVTEANFR